MSSIYCIFLLFLLLRQGKTFEANEENEWMEIKKEDVLWTKSRGGPGGARIRWPEAPFRMMTHTNRRTPTEFHRLELASSLLYRATIHNVSYCEGECEGRWCRGPNNCMDAGTCDERGPFCKIGTCVLFVEETKGNDGGQPEFTVGNLTCSPWSLKCFEAPRGSILNLDGTSNEEMKSVDCSESMYSTERYDPAGHKIVCSSSFTSVGKVAEVEQVGCKIVNKTVEAGCSVEDGFRHECTCEEDLCNDSIRAVAVGNDNDDIMRAIGQLKMDLTEKIQLQIQDLSEKIESQCGEKRRW